MAFRDTACHIIAMRFALDVRLSTCCPHTGNKAEMCVEGYEKVAIVEILEMTQTRVNHRAVFTAIMPPNICGPGKIS